MEFDTQSDIYHCKCVVYAISYTKQIYELVLVMW